MLIAAAAGVLAAPEPARVPGLSLFALLVLYVVPVVAIGFGVEFLSGAVFTLLVVAFLRLEKLRRPDSPAAVALAVLATLAALVAAPVLNRDTPIFDYETWALETSSSKSTSFSWDHSYAGLNWPRDGRELLRVTARQPAYWKAENLDEFDGRVWRRGRISYGVNELPDNRRTVQQLDAAHQGLDPQPAHGPVHHRGLRVRARDPAAADHPDARRPVRPAAHAAPRRRLHRARLHAAPDRAPAPCGRRRLRRRPVRVHHREHRRARRPGRRSPADDVPVLRHRPDEDHVRPAAQRAAGHGAARERPVPHLRARTPARRGRRHARGVRAARARPPRRRPVHLQRGAAEGVEHARRLPVRRQAGLLPAVLGRDGAVAADGRRPRAGRHGLLDRRHRHQDRRVHRARLRRALLGRGLLPRLGLAHVRPDAGRLARAQPARRLGQRPRLEFGRDAVLRRRPARRARRGRPHRPRVGPVVAVAPDRHRRARAARPARAGGPPLAPRRAAGVSDSSARYGAPAGSLRPGRPCTRSSRASPRRPRPPVTCARCARAATATRPGTRPARSAAGCDPSSDAGAGCGPSSCLVGPPTGNRGPTIGEMDDVYDLYQRGMALLEDGHFHQATSRSPRPAT